MIDRLWQGCQKIIFSILMIPCICCMLAGALAALPLGYDSGQEAAGQILDHEFSGPVTEVEFIDSPPIAIFPGGASEWVTWVVLELDQTQAESFEQAITARADWHPMPLPDELLVHGDGWLQPNQTIEGIPVTQSLPTGNTHGCYYYWGDLDAGSFTLALWDPETRRLYVNCKDR